MMKSTIGKLLIGAATLAIASAPLAASAQDWHRDHGRVVEHERIVRYTEYRHPVYRPVYRRYDEGFYGRAPGGYYAYYHNGGWYQYRRQHAGIWIYF